MYLMARDLGLHEIESISQTVALSCKCFLDPALLHATGEREVSVIFLEQVWEEHTAEYASGQDYDYITENFVHSQNRKQ